jgi:uncharacterized protein (TIGR03086 family)
MPGEDSVSTSDAKTGTAAAIDYRALHERASQHFARLVAQVADDQWDVTTPCSEWNVRALVDHVVRWNTFMPDLLNGLSIQEMMQPFERDILGDNAAAAAEVSAREAVAAFAAKDALERIVRHPMLGDVPASYAIFLRIFDNAVHGWDLARAIGADERIDPQILGALVPFVNEQRTAIRASGAYGSAEVDVEPDADTQTRMLGILGRRA